MHHNIVLIDDNFAIRQIIKIFLARVSRKYSFDLNIYTSDNGVEGLGYVFITNPNIIIIDTTLPKYSGKDIIEFFVQNKKFSSGEIAVIVLEEYPRKKFNLPNNFYRINKNKQNAFDQLTDILIEKLNISDYGRMSRLYDALGGFVMKNSNKGDLISQKISKEIKLKNAYHTSRRAILEIFVSVALSLIMLIFGRPNDDNISQLKSDRNTFRRKYYPTLALSFVSALFIIINVSLFAFSQFSIFKNQELDTRALTTFVVDTTADDADFSPGDGFCDTDDSVGDGPCTLRAAIEEANLLAGTDNIHFNIPGTAPFEILASSLLPTITSTINIDGMTQGGDCTTIAFSAPVAIISADPLSYNTKLIFSTGSENSTLKGMKFESAYVNIENTSDITVTCNWFEGTTTDERDNLYIVNSSDIMVGGVNWVDNYRNYFFNATRHGINIENSNSVSVLGNSIGLYETQTTQTAAGNNNAGIRITGNSNTINVGTSIAPSAPCSQGCNIISSNQIGVLVEEFSGTSVVITGNKIGTGRVAFEDFGNVFGVQFNGAVQVNSNRIVASNTGISASGDNWLIDGNWIGDNNIGNTTGIGLGSSLVDTSISKNVIMGNELGIHLGGINVGDLGPLLITENIIGIQADEITPAPNVIGINLVAGDNDDPYFDDSDIEIIENTISSNQTGLSHIAYVSGGNPYIRTISGNNFESNGTAIKFNLPVSIITSNNSFTNNAVSIEINEGNNNEILNNDFNQMAGVIRIMDSSYNIISQNSFKSDSYNITLLGSSLYNPITQNQFSTAYSQNIELSDDGPTINDLGDIDAGPNNFQNYPTNFSLDDSSINYTLDTQSGNYTIEFHILEEGSDLTPSSLLCSDTVIHTGGIQQFSIDCPNLPTGEINLQALAIKMLTTDEWGDTSEFSPIEILNNPGPTNTPTPTETPVPTTTNTPIPSATITPEPTTTNTPIPTATLSPIPTPTITPIHTPLPMVTSTSTPTSTNVPQNTSVPEITTALLPSVTLSPTPSILINLTEPTLTPFITVRPTSQIPVSIIENLDLDLSPNESYAISEDSILKDEQVKSTTLSFTNRLNNLTEQAPVIGSILKTTINVGERIKPLSDNLSYLLSLQFIGLQTAQSGVTTLNILALATPAIVTALSQPKLVYYALAWFWKRKPKNPWGIVYDNKTGTPVAFATLVLMRENETVATQASDLQGKFGFFADKGKYQIYISHSEYLDFASEIEVSYDGEIISKDFGLSSKSNEDFGSNLRWTYYKIKQIILRNLFILNTTLFSIGFVYTLFAITNHLTIINYLVLSLYLFQFLLLAVFSIFKDKEYGQVTDYATGLPIPGAIVRIFNEERQLDVAITDSQGRYSFLIEPGNYFIKASANGYIFPSEETPNTTTDKIGGKLLKFTAQDKQRVNIKIYMKGVGSFNPSTSAILSPFN